MAHSARRARPTGRSGPRTHPTARSARHAPLTLWGRPNNRRVTPMRHRLAPRAGLPQRHRDAAGESPADPPALYRDLGSPRAVIAVDPQAHLVWLTMSQDEMARDLAVTRKAVIQALGTPKEKGLARREGQRFCIVDRRELMLFAQGAHSLTHRGPAGDST
jgi:hypothetical protein